MLSHGSTSGVFIRLLGLNWRKEESALCMILLPSSHTSLRGVIFKKGEDVREAPRGHAELWFMLPAS